MLQKTIRFITVEQMREVDRLMIEEFKIEIQQMMENAGRNLARLAVRKFLFEQETSKEVIVLVGPGGNGGGAMVAARRLYNWGYPVSVYLSHHREKYIGVPGFQMQILKKMGLHIGEVDEQIGSHSAALIIDGLIGYSLIGSPRHGVAARIEWANNSNVPVLSLDVPSGIESTSGEIFEPAIQAAATLTLALPKTGFQNPGIQNNMGELFVADISVPFGVYERMGISREELPDFSENEIIRLSP